MSAFGMSAKILEKLIASDEDLPVEVARLFSGLALTPADLDRIREGGLDSEQTEELRLYALLADFLTIMHLRAEDSMGAKAPVA